MRWSLVLALLAGVAQAADDSSTESSSSTLALSDASTITDPSSSVPTGSYVVYGTTITLADGDHLTSTVTQNGTATHSNGTVHTTTHDSLTVLVGGGGTTTLGNSSMNATATPTSTATHTPVINTRPCNDYVEFCGRSYSNITMIGAHNSAFVQKNNAAANQDFDVIYQLDDGIRLLEIQAHNQNGTLYLCHTSCEILNVGTLEAWLTKVATWVKTHPYDVVTILMTNFDYVAPSLFVEPVKNSGLYNFRYTPSKIPMALDDWPTLSEMILRSQRVVFFLDYQANQTAYPWLLDEFSQMWETPFSPTDRNFPCTQQRPPNLARKDALNRMYMANHNLNIDLALGSFSMLIPNTAVINETNGVNGTGSLGDMARNCTAMWDRPPNVLLVDYYNDGQFNGSVFEVAAQMNNVTYDRKCCGTESAAVPSISGISISSLLLITFGAQLFLSLF